MQYIFHGHAFVEIIAQKKRLLIDPFIEGNTHCTTTVEQVISGGVDYITLTHGHSDHIGSTVEIAQTTGCTVIASFELANYLMNEQGLENVHPMGAGGEHDFGDFSLKLFQAHHGAMIGDMSSHYSANPTGLIIKRNNKTIYHAGDTALTYDMKLLGEYENVDLAFFPIGDNFTMGPRDAAIATSFVKPHVVVPVHYNTRPPISVDPQTFVQYVAEYAGSSQVHIAEVGTLYDI